ncbi:MAG: nitrile hydratase subunit beta [Hyphomicrobiales bacterium]|nr:nitrile hydratase subunit beta [Hyphomicrobiales bacterium]
MKKLLKVPSLAVPEQQAGAALPGDAKEPVFAEPWQAHAFAVIMSLYRDGHYTWAEWDDYLGYHIQAPGHFGGTDVNAGAIRNAAAEPEPRGANYSPFLADCQKDGSRFYHLWLAAAEHLLDATDLVPEAELEARIAAFEKAERQGPRFAAGLRVRVRDIKREGHTHLPLYLCGRTGVIERDQGLFVFPDAAGHGHDHSHGDDALQHVYCVRFSASDIWGAEASGTHALNFNLWDYQLEPAGDDS